MTCEEFLKAYREAEGSRFIELETLETKREPLTPGRRFLRAAVEFARELAKRSPNG